MIPSFICNNQLNVRHLRNQRFSMEGKYPMELRTLGRLGKELGKQKEDPAENDDCMRVHPCQWCTAWACPEVGSPGDQVPGDKPGPHPCQMSDWCPPDVYGSDPLWEPTRAMGYRRDSTSSKILCLYLTRVQSLATRMAPEHLQKKSLSTSQK